MQSAQISASCLDLGQAAFDDSTARRRHSALCGMALSISRRRLILLSTCLVFIWAAASPLSAQISNLSQVGEVPESERSRQEDLEAALEVARWTFGNTKIDPFIGITDGGWIRDAFDQADRETVDDFTLTFAAGLSLFHQIGEDSTLALWALPEYVWWQDLEDRRRLNGRYGAGWYGYFSRLALEFEARREEQQLQTTPEVRELTSQRLDLLRAGTAIDLYKSLALTAEASSRDFESLIEVGELGAGSPFSRLDRQEDVLQVGLRMRLRDAIDVEVGVFDVDTEFSSPDRRLDNQGDGVYLAWLVEGDRITWDTRLEQRRLEVRVGAAVGSFPEFDDLLGFSTLSFSSRSDRQTLGIYTRRGLFYALGSEFAYLLDDTIGGWWSSDLGSRLNLRLWAETAQLDYDSLVGVDAQRDDDVDRLGATLAIELPYRFDLLIGWQEQTVDVTSSGVPGSNFGQRDFSALTIGLGFREVRWP